MSKILYRKNLNWDIITIELKDLKQGLAVKEIITVNLDQYKYKNYRDNNNVYFDIIDTSVIKDSMIVQFSIHGLSNV